MKTESLGQALTEFALLCIIIGLVISVTGALLLQHGRRAACAYFVFETIHARRASRREPRSSIPITILESPSSIKGTASCGKWTETVELPYLETVQW